MQLARRTPLVPAQSQRGFTIVELLIVIVVIGILATITIVAFNGVQRSALIATVKVDLANLSEQMALYKIDHGAYPNMIQVVYPPPITVLDDMAEILKKARVFDDTRGMDAKKKFRFCPTADQSDYVVVATNPYIPVMLNNAQDYVGTTIYYATSYRSVQSTEFTWNSEYENLGWNLCNSVGPEYAITPPGLSTSWSHDMPEWIPRDEPVAFDQPDDCPTGFIPVPGSPTYGTEGGFCVMKYEAKNVGGVPTSQVSGTPWVSITQTDAIAVSQVACSGCSLLSEAEWLTIAQNVVGVGSNWTGGSVGSGALYGGHSDAAPFNSLEAAEDSDGYSGTGDSPPSNQRRTLTLTNGEVIWDLAGNVWEWTTGVTEGGNQPGGPGYAWREWNLLPSEGSLTPGPNPVLANSLATNWNSDQSIGQIHSDSTQTGLRAFRRGGDYNANIRTGVFSLYLNNSPNAAIGYVGFRVSR